MRTVLIALFSPFPYTFFSFEISSRYKVVNIGPVMICRAEGLTGGNDTLVLTIALNFSGQEDIVTATKNIAKRVSDGHLDICEINRSLMSENLSLSHIVKEHENPDLLIRTGGEQRLSNFVLWHLAYTELYFSQVYWPDFNEKHLMEALREYSRRDRRFGARSLD